MATVRPFAVNLGSAVRGTNQYGKLAIGLPTDGYSATGLDWYHGPDEDLGYIIGYYNGNAPTFWRSSTKDEGGFLALFVPIRLGTENDWNDRIKG